MCRLTNGLPWQWRRAIGKQEGFCKCWRAY
jgi:hypothetical protein